MKKLLAVFVLISALAFKPSFAADEAAAPAAPSKDKQEMRKKIEAKKQELNGSEWEVQLVASGDPKAQAQTDVLTFQNGQVKSKIFSAKDFKPTNYTITVEDGNDNTVWETMQTSSKEGVVFIRGEWNGDTMRGIVSQQLEGGNTRDYSFSTLKKTAVEPTTEQPKPAAEAVVAEASAPAAPAAEASVAAEAAPAAEVAAAPVEAAAEAAPAEESAPVEEKKTTKKKRGLF